jgi:hypothetical protein
LFCCCCGCFGCVLLFFFCVELADALRPCARPRVRPASPSRERSGRRSGLIPLSDRRVS